MPQPQVRPYQPRFGYTDHLVGQLMAIEGARRAVDHLRLPPDESFRIQYEARRRATHHSTRIEGNPLALESVPLAVAGSDRTGSVAEQEVRNYWRALEWLEEQVERRATVDEDFIRRLHRIIIVRGRGRRGERSDYRTDEIAVRDSRTGAVEYAPPAPADVPQLMAELAAWRGSREAGQLPVPLRAAILAHRFVTIHPFLDGNGRTARALATAELWLGGYAMRGFLSVEEHYAENLEAYYQAIQMGLPANYYEGRHDCDLTPWLAFFVGTLAKAAFSVQLLAVRFTGGYLPRTPWEELSRRQQQVMMRLVGREAQPGAGVPFRPSELVEWFGVSGNTAREWLQGWTGEGFVVPAGGKERITAYRLREDLEQIVLQQ